MPTLTIDQKTLPIVPVDASTALLEALIELFKVKIRNDNTRHAYKHALDRFTTWATRQKIAFEDIRAGDIADYIEEIGQTYAITTVKQNLAILRRFFGHLEMAGVIGVNPAASVPSPRFKRHTGATPYLNRKQVRKLLKSVDRDTKKGRRNYAVLLAFLYTGCRVSALARLKVSDFYAVGDTHFLKFHEKNSLVYDQICHPLLVEAIKVYIDAEAITGDQPLFQTFNTHEKGASEALTGKPMDRISLYKLIKRLATKAGFDKISPHSLRVSCANSLFASEASVETVQKLLQHRSSETTKLYIRESSNVTQEDILKISY